MVVKCLFAKRTHTLFCRPSHAKVFLDLLSERQILDIADDCIRFVEAKVCALVIRGVASSGRV